MQLVRWVFLTGMLAMMSVSPVRLAESADSDLQLSVSSQLEEVCDAQRPVMVVFVHGTILPYIKLGMVKKLLRDFSSSISYDHTVADVLRYQGCYQYQPIADYGLRLLSEADGVCSAVHRRNQLYGSLFEKIWKHTFGQHIAASYVFGWDGSLSAARRILASQALYNSLVRERENVALANNCLPMDVEIVLVAHSHGGSLGLLLAQEETAKQHGLSIEHLILLGTPVQQETEYLVHHQMFCNIWSLYSMGDVVQVLDVVTTKGASKRYFASEHQPASLRQCAIELIEEATGDTYLPSHVQLWFYDVQHMQPFFLQAYSPFNPLPISLFTPLILKLLMHAPNHRGPVRIGKKDGNVFASVKTDRVLFESDYGRASVAASAHKELVLPYALFKPYEKHFFIS